MKATKKLFGAVALSAALAMGTALPAFAAPDAGSVTDGTHKAESLQAGTADTVVNVKTTNTQIDVAVPLKVLFNAESAGGALGAPSAGTYKIKNYSAAPVYLTKATVGYADSNANGTIWEVTDKDINPGQQPSSDDAAFFGDLQIKVKYTPSTYDSKTQQVTAGTEVTKAIADGTEIIATGAKNAIYIAKSADGTTPTDFVIDWSGTSSILNKVDTNGADAIKVTYTVSTNAAIDSADDALTQ